MAADRPDHWLELGIDAQTEPVTATPSPASYAGSQLTGEFAGVVFIIGFAIFFGWQISGFIRRNKPRNYTFSSVPQELLP